MLESANSKPSLSHKRLGVKATTVRPDSPQAGPPPFDEWTDSSLSSSISLVDSPGDGQLHQIKDINKEIRRAATMAIKKFKTTSKDLQSMSRLDSVNGSLLFSDIECIKKTLCDVAGHYKEKSHCDAESSKQQNISEVCDLGAVLGKIQEIQKEIQSACERLEESEKLIADTEKNNEMLEEKIRKLESNAGKGFVTEGEEENHSNCVCALW
jgi:hypothetical protein